MMTAETALPEQTVKEFVVSVGYRQTGRIYLHIQAGTPEEAESQAREIVQTGGAASVPEEDFEISDFQCNLDDVVVER